MLQEPRSPNERFALAMLCAMGVFASALLFGPALWHTAHGVTDFMPLYAGGKLAFSPYLYDPARVLRVEMASGGWSSPTRLFTRPPFVAALFWPLARLPYRLASSLWEAISAAAFAGFVAFSPRGRRWTVAVACCWSLPVFMAVAESQDIGFLLLWIALATGLMRKHRDFAAGMVASLCADKFQLFLLIPLWIIGKSQWRFGRGLAAGGAILVAISTFAGGLDWPLRYYRFLIDPANRNNPGLEIMPNLRAAFLQQAHATELGWIGIVLVVAVVWLSVRHANTECGLATALAGGILVAPHVYMADCALLIPAAVSVLADAGSGIWTRMSSLGVLLPVAWVPFLLGAGAALPARAALLLFLFALAWEAREREIPVYNWLRSTVEKKNFNSSAAVSGASEP